MLFELAKLLSKNNERVAINGVEHDKISLKNMLNPLGC